LYFGQTDQAYQIGVLWFGLLLLMKNTKIRTLVPLEETTSRKKQRLLCVRFRRRFTSRSWFSGGFLWFLPGFNGGYGCCCLGVKGDAVWVFSRPAFLSVWVMLFGFSLPFGSVVPDVISLCRLVGVSFSDLVVFTVLGEFLPAEEVVLARFWRLGEVVGVGDCAV
jgi:hypothetical protein